MKSGNKNKNKIIKFLKTPFALILYFSTYILGISNLVESGLNWHNAEITTTFILVIIFSINIIWTIIKVGTTGYKAHLSYKAGKHMINGDK